MRTFTTKLFIRSRRWLVIEQINAILKCIYMIKILTVFKVIVFFFIFIFISIICYQLLLHLFNLNHIKEGQVMRRY